MFPAARPISSDVVHSYNHRGFNDKRVPPILPRLLINVGSMLQERSFADTVAKLGVWQANRHGYGLPSRGEKERCRRQGRAANRIV